MHTAACGEALGSEEAAGHQCSAHEIVSTVWGALWGSAYVTFERHTSLNGMHVGNAGQVSRNWRFRVALALH